MPHIHTEPGQYDFTVSMYIVNISNPEQPITLLHQHKKLNLLMQAGGHVELDEHTWSSVAHELLEETGYELDQLQVLQPSPLLVDKNLLNHPVPLLFNSGPFLGAPDHHHANLTYAFITAETPRHPVAAGESDTLRWYTLAQIDSMPEAFFFPGVPTLLRQLLKNWHEWDAVPAANYPA